jgi:DNA-binding beta-propeller fold protein YncE
VVNNSHLIYKINSKTGLYEAKTSQLTSPRHLLKIDENKALISDLYEKSLAVINTETMEIISHIPIGRTSENMLKVGNEVFVANWSAYNQEQKNNMLMVVDVETLQLTDSIQVPLEPNSMVLDKDNNIWVLGSGGFLNEERPALWRIDPELKMVTKRFIFNDINSSPANLCINPEGSKLYFLNKDVYQMDITTNLLSAKPFVAANETNNFYSLGVGRDANIYITDANDYTRNGTVFRYTSEGVLKQSFEAGIIPGAIGFKD